MRLHYTGFMARKTTPKKAVGKRPVKKRKPGKPKPWTPAEVEEAFRRFSKASPGPQTELQYVNPYTLLVAVVLSAQATDAGVNKATPALFAAADTPEKMAELGEEKVRDFIKTIGLYRNKAKNVVELSRRLVAEHGGRCRASAKRSRRCPASGARPRTSCSMWRSARRRSPSTRISSASATAPTWRPD